MPLDADTRHAARTLVPVLAILLFSIRSSPPSAPLKSGSAVVVAAADVLPVGYSCQPLGADRPPSVPAQPVVLVAAAAAAAGDAV